MARNQTTGPVRRDRALRRVRAATWAAGLAAAGLTGAFSAAAAHAFKGHDGKAAASSAPAPVRVSVPPPQHVPSIGGQPSQLQPPASPPQSSAPQPAQPQPQPAPAPAPPPVSSGGS